MKKFLVILSLLLCMVLVFTSCGGSSGSSRSNDNDPGDSGYESEDNNVSDDGDDSDYGEDNDEPDYDSSDESSADSGDITSITKYSDYWNDMYQVHEAAINAYEGIPPFELFTAGMCFLSAVQYDLLNLQNKDGRFEGELMLAGWEGFVEKNGKKYVFGYDDVREEDGFSPDDKVGDRLVENGNCDLDAGYFFSDQHTERDGVILDRSATEMQILKDGSMACIVIDGDTTNARGDEELRNTATFIRSGKDIYEFVIAQAKIGPEFEMLALKSMSDITSEQAVKLFEDAGFTITSTGGVNDGKLVVEKFSAD